MGGSVAGPRLHRQEPTGWGALSIRLPTYVAAAGRIGDGKWVIDEIGCIDTKHGARTVSGYSLCPHSAIRVVRRRFLRPPAQGSRNDRRMLPIYGGTTYIVCIAPMSLFYN